MTKKLPYRVAKRPQHTPLEVWTERLALAVAAIMPFSAMPQIWQIYTTQEIRGISLLAWLLPALGSVVWIAYGIAHRLRPIIVAQSLWFIFEMIVVAQVIFYGR